MQARCSVFLLAALLVVAVRAASLGDSPGACPKAFTGIGLGMCVMVHSLVEQFDGRLPWTATNELCEEQGGRLISLDTPAKLERLSEYLYETNADLAINSVWVGARRTSTGWSWLNSSPLPLESNMWLPNHPIDDPTYAYGRMIPGDRNQRHYLLSNTAEAIAPGYVCEPSDSSVA